LEPRDGPTVEILSVVGVTVKAAFVCFDFRPEYTNRQPWKYVLEICKGLKEKGIEVKVFSNAVGFAGIEVVAGIEVRYVKCSGSMLLGSNAISTALDEEAPDVVFVLIGLSSLLRQKPDIQRPTIAILTSPLYSINEILGLGGSELIRHIGYIAIHILGAIVPRILIAKRAESFRYIIVLSVSNKKRLTNCGVNPERIVVVSPGVHDDDLELCDARDLEILKEKIAPEGLPIVLYFGSPLSLRGTDDLVRAFACVHRIVPAKLVILLRMDDRACLRELEVLLRIAEAHHILNQVIVESTFLSRHVLRQYIQAADIVCLPFKLVISDVPIAILEAMALGKPIISTCLDGIPELLAGRGAIVLPGQPAQLASIMNKLIADNDLSEKLGKRARNYMLNYATWEQQSDKILSLIKQVSGYDC